MAPIASLPRVSRYCVRIHLEITPVLALPGAFYAVLWGCKKKATALGGRGWVGLEYLGANELGYGHPGVGCHLLNRCFFRLVNPDAHIQQLGAVAAFIVYVAGD